MTSPPEPIEAACPGCGHRYVDWYRPSINLSLDVFDDDYLEEASTTTCPECGGKYDLGTLFARRGGEGGTSMEVGTEHDGAQYSTFRRTTSSSVVIRP